MRKLANRDLIAIKAVYHLACLCDFYRRAETLNRDQSQTKREKVIKSQVFNGLLKYAKRLTSLGYPESQGHTTRLRQDIVAMIPDLKVIEKSSGYWELVFDKDLNEVVEELKDTTSKDIRILAQAAKILRQDSLAVK